MSRIELGDGFCWSEAMASEFIEAQCRELGLGPAKGTLASIPNCVHWHMRKKGSAGTLEATWDPRTNQLWLKQHPLRAKPWTCEAARAICLAAEKLRADS